MLQKYITLVDYCDGCETEVSKNEIRSCAWITDTEKKITKKGHISCIERLFEVIN